MGLVVSARHGARVTQPRPGEVRVPAVAAQPALSGAAGEHVLHGQLAVPGPVGGDAETVCERGHGGYCLDSQIQNYQSC